ncbi:hypothetical protein cypCar_00008322 [Cyprinus carpio]|nr:hypothetical protein cypCar_00008322 [Cyprinus carpio]
MKPQEKMFFKDPVKLVQSRLEHIAQIAIFQKRQKERVIAFLRSRSVELERKVKEVRDQCYRQVCELKQENEELKKPLSQRRRNSKDDSSCGCHITSHTSLKSCQFG